MDVALVAGVPDELVAWCLESVVERHGEFGHSETGPEVAPYLGGHIYVAFPSLHYQFVKLLPGEPSHVFGSVYLVQ